jgi:hypothetical protein
MLTIKNQHKLLGTRLAGSGRAGPTEWVVTSIKAHIRHYVIFVEETQNGWDKKIVLDRYHSVNHTGYQYKLECGSFKKYVPRDNIKNMDIFSSCLKSLI